MNRRTTITFRHEDPVGPEMQAWAAETGFRLKSEAAGRMVYQKGHGIWMAPMMVSVTQLSNEVRLEAWIRSNWLYRAMSLFLIPREMGIESGGYWMMAPRRIARQAVNRLLSRLGQQSIP